MPPDNTRRPVRLEWSGEADSADRTRNNNGQWQQDSVWKRFMMPSWFAGGYSDLNEFNVQLVHYSGYTGAAAGIRRVTVHLRVNSKWFFAEFYAIINGVRFDFTSVDYLGPGSGGREEYRAEINPAPNISPINPDGPNDFSGVLHMIPVEEST